mmetsp:Transcript_5573/g.8542  ORF Transcript_5573/g.8542 Transcript_5573/m.8542 type:complete len:180 (+) Transcript_5573:2045-2584(+)
MAYFLILNESRYLYSHENNFMPVNGYENFLLEKQLTVSIRLSLQQNIVYHRAMDYIYRPEELNDICAYEFIQNYKMVKRKNKDELQFIHPHPFKNSAHVFKLDMEAVPIFSWTFLESNLSFESSVISAVSSDNPQYELKENYARRFMTLFYPWQNIADLKFEDSYQKQLCLILEEKKNK